MKADVIFSALLEHAASSAWRIALGGALAAFVTLVIVLVAILIARKKKLLHVGAPVDPWGGRLIVVAWIVVVLPAGVAAGAFVGAAFAAAHAVESTHVTEKASALAMRAVVDELIKDPQIASVVHDRWIAIDRVAPVIDRAPVALAQYGAHGAELAIRGDEKDGFARTLATRIASAIAYWLVKSQAEDRLKIVSPVLKDLIQRDVDRDGKVAVDDVVASITRIHLEPRVGHLAFDLVVSQAYAAIGIALAVLLAPILICFGVRKYRGRAA